MSGRYSSDQLLKLRESPLVARPTTLPPLEEWMGPPAEQIASKRTTVSAVKAEPSGRATQKVVNGGTLASAKTPFSATFKSGSTPFESPSRSAFGNFGAGTPREEYFPKGRYVRSGEDGNDERPAIRSRRTDPWSSTQDEDDRGGRKGGGRDGDNEARDGRRQRGIESGRKDGGDEARRNGAGRAERPSWLRDNTPLEKRPQESARSGGWRDAGPRRGQGRDWQADDRDAEPEWMASDDRSDAQSRTVQDIEQWKASMRARDQGSAPPEVNASPNQHSRQTSQAATIKPKAETPLMLDPSVDDKFFGILGGPRPASSGNKGEPAPSAAKPAKASKFSGFFGPQTPASVTDAIAPPPSLPAAAQQPLLAEDDKAGFQRILAMLAGPQGNPLTQDGLQSSKSAPPHRTTPPPMESATLYPANSPPPIISPRSRRPGAIGNLLGMQNTREGAMQGNAPILPNAPTNKDADFLLTLLKSRDAEAQQQSNMSGNAPPGFFGNQSRLDEGRARSTGGGDANHLREPGMYDELLGPHHLSSAQSRGGGGGGRDAAGLGPEGHHHPPYPHNMPHNQHHDSQQPLYDDHEAHHPRERGAGNYPPYPPMGMPQHPPPGLHRPPGFEHLGLPMPGFPPFMNPPSRPPGEMIRAPPGLGGGVGSGRGFPPGLIAQMGSLGLVDERGGGEGRNGPLPPQHPHFGLGGGHGGPGGPGGSDGPGGPRGPPPGFGPGPGPNGMPLPPRGYPHMHPDMEGFPHGHGHPPPGSHGPQHGPPPPPGRMMEMFDGFGGGGGRGGLPPSSLPPGQGHGQSGAANAPPPGFERR